MFPYRLNLNIVIHIKTSKTLLQVGYCNAIGYDSYEYKKLILM